MKRKGLIISMCVLGIVLLVLFSVAVSGFFGLIREESKERRAGQREAAQRTRESATQVQRDPLFETSCVPVSAIPSGQTGDFCVQMKAGVVTEKIKPPYYTNVGIYPFVPAELRYFDYDGKEMAVVKVSGRSEDCFTSPNGWTSFTILMKEDGGVRVRIGGKQSRRFAKCS